MTDNNKKSISNNISNVAKICATKRMEVARDLALDLAQYFKNHTEPRIFDPYEEAAARNKALVKDVFGRKLPSYCMWDYESVGHPETWGEWWEMRNCKV